VARSSLLTGCRRQSDPVQEPADGSQGAGARNGDRRSVPAYQARRRSSALPAINGLVLQAEDTAPGTAMDHEFINACTTGFAEFAERTRRLSWPDVLEATGLSRADIEQVVERVPNPVNEHRFPTPSGKAVFTCNTFDRIRLPEGHLVMQTMRTHDQWNTVPYALNDRYRGIHNGRRVVLVNPADIEELGLADRQLVDLVSTWDDGIASRAKGFRVVAYPAARGSAASYYPETNVLVPLDSVAEISNTPTSKGVYMRIEPASGW
jgi:anaerobic selenocysteine-containing dehydrogenase